MDIFKFNPDSAITKDQIMQSGIVNAIKLIEEKNDYSLLIKYNYHVVRDPSVKTGGWYINFKKYLKTFWVKLVEGTDSYIVEVYALNKSDIRKNKQNICLYGKIDKIIEVR